MKIKMLSFAAYAMLFALPACKKNDTPAPTPTPVPAISITSFSPASGPKNTLVSIRGISFGAAVSGITVYFNGVAGVVQTVVDTLITATVPAGAGTGIVKVEKNSVQVSGAAFTYFGAGYTSTFAGSFGGYADGTGTAAQFQLPTGIVKDAAGNLFVADRDNHRIRKITPAGVVTTLAGSGVAGYADGTGTAAKFNLPFGLGIDAAGNLYVGEIDNHAIRKVTPAGVVTTFVGNPVSQGFQDGTGTGAKFSQPVGLVFDAAGNLFVADYNNSRIRKVTPAGVVTTIAGNAVTALTDGTGTAASFDHPVSLAFDAAGNLIVSDYFNNAVRKITPAALVTTIAGNGTAGYIDGNGAAARFDRPSALAVDANGNVYLCDANNDRIRKVTSTGTVTTLAGSAIPGGNADGDVSVAGFHYPLGLCADFTNNYLFIVDYFNHRIRRVNLN